MSIDRRTALHLELISNAQSGNQKESLFGVINHTKTVVGGRLLRSSILRPSTGEYLELSVTFMVECYLYIYFMCADIPTITTRLDMVELFLR